MVDQVYLPPQPPVPLEGEELLRFLQSWIVGVCGLDGKLVRPRLQPEPANIPMAGTVWAAIGIAERPADTYPFVGQRPGADAYRLQRHEELWMLCSFYDLGSTGEADKYATILRDGLSVPQNLEVLYSQNMALAYVGQLQQGIPTLIQRWLYRVDLPLVVRRQITRTYGVPNIEIVDGTIVTDSGLTRKIHVENEQ